MSSRYQLTITADTLAELTGRVTEVASQLQAGDAGVAIAAELAPLAEAPATWPVTIAGEQVALNGEQSINAALPAAIPTPPPDYQGAGLTDYQALQARAAQPAPIYVPPATSRSRGAYAYGAGRLPVRGASASASRGSEQSAAMPARPRTDALSRRRYQ